MAIVEVQVEQWQERAIQVLVLLSFSMQLVLLVLAEFRRRIDSGMLRVVIWSAYVLADSTALYTLGHLSVTSRSGDHKLMAFWAPFLLVHLGGQDNITAYAIEDNQLWRRHLQTLTVQVAAAAYILYESTIVGTEALLRSAAVLMFVVGIVKYGERVWALKRADTSASANGYESLEENTRSLTTPPTDQRHQHTEYLLWLADQGLGTVVRLLQVAYLLLDIPKDMIQGPLSSVELHLDNIQADELYKVVEMQLGLMHDALYSKAEVIHTWYGLCIRVISPVFTAIAFVLFHRSALSAGDRHSSRADVTITYVLSGGAVTLEIVSVLRAMFSRWPSLILWKLAYYEARVKRPMWVWLARAVTSIRLLVLLERHESRWWSDSMGQYNLIDLCISNKDNRASRTVSSILSWMGIQDRWNTLVYSRSIPVPMALKEIVVEHVLRSRQRSEEMYYSSLEEKQDFIINSRGQAALRKRGLHQRLGRFVDMELDDSIIVWHLATDIFLHYRKDQGLYVVADLRRLMVATEVISNYMFFLFVARPYMLPGYVSHTRYTEICYHLTGLKCNTAKDLMSLLMSEFNQKEDQNNILYTIHDLAHELLSLGDAPLKEVLEMISEVWTEMLCYAGYRCSGYSHAKQLSNGGELLTIVALVVEYRRRDILLL